MAPTSDGLAGPFCFWHHDRLFCRNLPLNQTRRFVAKLGMPIELARLLAQKGLMLVPAASADEFEGFPYVFQADAHADSCRSGIILHNVLAHPGFRGDGATIASTSVVSSAFPRFLALCTNWKNAR
jgi:hypothetical protein